MISEYYINSIIEFNITNYCNAKCPLCPRFKSGTQILKVPLLHLPKNIIIDTMAEVKDAGSCRHISLCGDYGDPLMHPDILEIIKASYDIGIPMFISTNGGLRDSDFFHTIGKYYTNTSIIFGIDGLEDTSHIHRVDVDFDLAFDNLITFSKAAKKGKCYWQFICFDYNYHQLDEVFDICQNNNIIMRGHINTRNYNKNFQHTIIDKDIIKEIHDKFNKWTTIQNHPVLYKI